MREHKTFSSEEDCVSSQSWVVGEDATMMKRNVFLFNRKVCRRGSERDEHGIESARESYIRNHKIFLRTAEHSLSVIMFFSPVSSVPEYMSHTIP